MKTWEKWREFLVYSWSPFPMALVSNIVTRFSKRTSVYKTDTSDTDVLLCFLSVFKVERSDCIIIKHVSPFSCNVPYFIILLHLMPDNFMSFLTQWGGARGAKAYMLKIPPPPQYFAKCPPLFWHCFCVTLKMANNKLYGCGFITVFSIWHQLVWKTIISSAFGTGREGDCWHLQMVILIGYYIFECLQYLARLVQLLMQLMLLMLLMQLVQLLTHDDFTHQEYCHLTFL